MKVATTSERLRQLLRERNMKQIDILEAAKPYTKETGISLNKNDLSQYVSGKTEPGQRKLSILGLALNVNEAWLMGYNVSMEREYNECHKSTENSENEKATIALTDHEEELVQAYRNNPDMQTAVDRLLKIEQPVMIRSFRAACSEDNHEPEIIDIEDLSNIPESDDEGI